MKKEIEELNLIYGVAIYSTMLIYKDFYTKDMKKRKNIYRFINDFFLWLEKQTDITSDNVVIVGQILLENKDIRRKIFENNVIDLYTISLKKLMNIDFKNIRKLIDNTDAFMALPFLKDDDLNDQTFFEIIDTNIYSNKLIYSDLIQLFMMNYTFPKKINMMSSYNYCLNFINNLNITFYQLDKILHSNREDLYYCSLYLFEHKYTKDILFPRCLSRQYHFDKQTISIIISINSFIARALHFINRYYFIEVPKFKYDNSTNYLSKWGTSENDIDLIKFLLKDLSIKQQLFIFKLGSKLTPVEKNYFMTDVDIEEMNSIMSIYKKNKDITVLSQQTNDKYKDLIEKNAMGVQKYCDDNNIVLKDFIYSPNFNTTTAKVFIEFSIMFNDFEYKFALRKFNFRFTWNVKLKTGREYKINLYLEDDYKHIIQAIYND